MSFRGIEGLKEMMLEMLRVYREIRGRDYQIGKEEYEDLGILMARQTEPGEVIRIWMLALVEKDFLSCSSISEMRRKWNPLANRYDKLQEEKSSFDPAKKCTWPDSDCTDTDTALFYLNDTTEETFRCYKHLTSYALRLIEEEKAEMERQKNIDAYFEERDREKAASKD